MNELVIRTGLERTLLRSLFLDQEYLEEIMNILGSTGKHFDEDYSKKSYDAILSLFYANREFNEFNFITELGLSISKPAATAQYVKILSATPTNNPVEVAYTILEQAIKRQLYFLGENIKKKAMGSDSYTDIYLDIDNTLKEINQDTLNNNLKHLSAIVKEFNGLLDKYINPLNLKTVTSGYKQFDAKLKGGFSAGQFVIIAARPSMGKSALMSDMAVRMAKQKIPVAIFSLEMTQQELMLRMLNQAAGKDIIGDRNDILKNKEVRQFLDHMATYPIYVDDSGRMDMVTLKTKARRLVRENNVQIVFLDYLQLMHTNNHNTREREVAELSRDLKLLAKDLSIPVVCLAQLNRAVEMRDGKMPMLSDLRESGSIEQDADVVMFVHRKQYYDASADDAATINFAKNRTTGEIGDVPLTFNKETASFI